MFENMDVVAQFPALAGDEVAKVANRLKERFGYEYFPTQYGEFLTETNGCVFQARAEESRIMIETELPFLGLAPVSGIFGVWFERFDGLEPSHLEWPELFASNENSKENFGVLPDNMMSLAYEKYSGSLFAISTDQRDQGCVYYYHDDYFYRIVGRQRMLEQHGYCYYDRKLKNTLRRHGISLDVLADLDDSNQLEPYQIIDLLGDISEACRFELNRNEFVLVADSFDEFLQKLKVEAA